MQLPSRPLIEQVPLPGPVSLTVREFKLPAFTYPWHQHPEVELTWIVKGSGLRYVGDSVESFHEGDFCLLGPHLPHTWLSSKSKRTKVQSLVVQFDPARWGNDLLRLPEFVRITNLLKRAARGLCFNPRLGARLSRKILDERSPLCRFTALLEILGELASRRDARTLALAPWPLGRRHAPDARLRKVLAYLSENVGGPICQAEAARLVGLTPAAFSRFFRRSVGKTFQAYLTDMRISEVCRQLLETERSISEIAFNAGFGNLSNFNRAFRIVRGMSPGTFRHQSLKAI